MSGAILYGGSVGVCVGIALALLLPAGIFFATAFLAVAIVSVFLFVVSKDKKCIVAAVVCCAAVLGVARTETFLQSEASKDLSHLSGQATVVGVVVNDPERRDTSLHVVVEVQIINNADARGTLLATVNRDERIFYGDTVQLSGTLQEPEAFETETGHTFDYKNYLAVRGVSALMQRAVVERVDPGGFSVQKSLYALKHQFQHSIEKLFPEPNSALLEGMLLGERRGMPKELQDAFVASGLVHIVVLSGYNISIVATAVFDLLSFLSRGASFAAGAVVMVAFALMTGAGATTVRALIMALIALLAQYLGRPAAALRSLAVAGAGMALWNPLTLLHDPSFILSMLATFGLITLSPWVERYVPHRLPPLLRNIIATTIAVQLFVLPALLYFTGIFSLLSVPANVLALPAVPYTMLLGFMAGALGLLHPILAFAPTLFGDLLLRWIIIVAQFTESVPFSIAVIPEFSAWIIVALYIPLTYAAIWLSSHSATRK